MSVRSRSDETSFAPNGIDHLLYASANLQQGMDEIESLLGVRPVRGGRHPQYGTHNALVSLGPGVYLEIIARDPRLPAPQRGALIDVPPKAKSRLATWVYRNADIHRSAAAAGRASIGLGIVESGRRAKLDGSEIGWQLTDPYAMPFDGAIPFLINWGNAAHPSASAPSGGRLVELVIAHPEPDPVRGALSVLAAEVEVIEGEKFHLSATIAVGSGTVILR
jgi:hypothetical protein